MNASVRKAPWFVFACTLLATALTAQAQTTYGPIRPGDDLWDIARRVYPDHHDLTMDQVMLALLRANPQAFAYPCNANGPLHSGVVLRVPSVAEVAALNRDEAQREFLRQSREWDEHRHARKPLACPPLGEVAPMPSQAGATHPPAAAGVASGEQPQDQAPAIAPSLAPARSQAEVPAAQPAPPPTPSEQTPVSASTIPLGTIAVLSGPPTTKAEAAPPPDSATPLATWQRLWARIDKVLARHQWLAWLTIPILASLIAGIVVWRYRRAPAKAPQAPVVMSPQTTVPGVPPTDRSQGLTRLEAEQRLAQYGANAIADKPVPAWRQLASKFWAPVPWMLETVIVLQLLLGRGLEALVIAALLVFNAVVAFAQEQRAKDALALLRKHLHVNARALRDGQWRQLPAEQVVPGDVVHVRAGDIVPADLTLFDGAVALDQAALTGESLPVDAGPGRPAYTGAVVRQGEASGTVTATGAHTFFGRTAELVRTSNAPSHMQRTIFAIVKRLVVFDAALVALVIVFALWHHLPLLDTALFSLMLLVASVPVALPATYTLATAVSSQRLAHQGVLVTRLPAVEEAAAMDTLVSDKTGTLTQNSLSYADAIALAENTDKNAVLRAAALASDESTQDPLDLAILAPARERGLLSDAPPRCDFHPFDPTTRRSEGVYATSAGEWHAVKGAANAIGPLCRLGAEQQKTLDAAEHRLAESGARVLAVAAGPGDALQLLGVVGLADPPRPDAAALISQITQLGVRVCMATGDAQETARAIGARLGLGTRVCEAQAPNPEDCDLYARVLPEDKHHIVAALQQGGHVTGMTGDGVNDAPALRQAELGIAVASATDVAKAAAGVVLTDPGLGGVLTVLRTGREVHRRMLTYTLNKTLKVFEIVVFLTLGLMLTGSFVISPMLIVLLLFTNDFVTMTIATDRVQPAPKPQRWAVGRLVGAALVFAALSLLFSFSVYWWTRSTQGLSPTQLQTLVFLLLVFTNQACIYVLRTDGRLWSFAPSRWMALASAGDLVLVTALALLGWLMAPLPAALVLGLLGACVLFALLLDQAKRYVFPRFAIV